MNPHTPMTIEIRYFGQIRRFAGVNTQRVGVETGATVAALLRRVVDGRSAELAAAMFKDAGCAVVRGSLMVLVNEQPAEPDTTLADGDVVSLIPPIGGG